MKRLITLPLIIAILLAGCASAATPAPMQTATLLPLTLTFTSTPLPTETLTPTPTPYRVVMFSDMSPEGGPEQCAQNPIDLNSPNFDQQLQAWMESIRKQAGAPDTTISLRVMPDTSPITGSDAYYKVAEFFFQSSGGRFPIVACGEVRLGDATGRIQFTDSFPFPTADGGTEPITIGLVSEPNAEKLYHQWNGTTDLFGRFIDDSVVFPALQRGESYLRLKFFINPYSTLSTDDPIRVGNEAIAKRNIEITGSVIVPHMLDEQEAQQFSDLFIKVFYEGNRSPEVLSALKALMQDHLLAGFVQLEDLP